MSLCKTNNFVDLLQQHVLTFLLNWTQGRKFNVAKKIQQKLLTQQTQSQTMLPRYCRIPAGASLHKLTLAHEDTRVSRQYVKTRKSTARRMPKTTYKKIKKPTGRKLGICDCKMFCSNQNRNIHCS